MSSVNRLSRRVLDADDPGSLAGRARQHRWRELVRRFPSLGDMRVIDLGGRPSFWRSAPVRPAHVTTVNLEESRPTEPWLAHRTGDACDLPADVRSERFDLVVSNSLLEHVGGHARRQQVADAVHELSDLHWVQTPYRYFPLEPHWLFPGFQFLPFRARVEVTRAWPFGWMHSRDPAVATSRVAEVELLTATQLRSYFPRSEIWKERAHGVTKSLVAISA